MSCMDSHLQPLNRHSLCTLMKSTVQKEAAPGSTNWHALWEDTRLINSVFQTQTSPPSRTESESKVLMEPDWWPVIIAWVTGGVRADTHSGVLSVSQATSQLPLEVVCLHRGGARAAVTHLGNKRANWGEKEPCPHRYFCPVFTPRGHIPAARSKKHRNVSILTINSV